MMLLDFVYSIRSQRIRHGRPTSVAYYLLELVIYKCDLMYSAIEDDGKVDENAVKLLPMNNSDNDHDNIFHRRKRNG